MGGAEGSVYTLANNIVAFLKGNNTAGAANYISSGLVRPLLDGNVIVGKPELGQAMTQFPCVFVKVSAYHDEIGALSKGAKRPVTYALEIYPVTNLVSTTDRSAPMNESYKLTDNILGLIRAKDDLSMGGHWVNEIDVTYDEEVESAVKVLMNKISLQSRELAA